MKRGSSSTTPPRASAIARAQMSALIDRMRERGPRAGQRPDLRARATRPRSCAASCRAGLDLVAVCGGDGTVSEAACGLVGSAVPLAVLPGGTSNVLARELGIPLDSTRAEELLSTGTPPAVRFGHATSRPFLLWAGVGLDARSWGI